MHYKADNFVGAKREIGFWFHNKKDGSKSRVVKVSIKVMNDVAEENCCGSYTSIIVAKNSR